MTPVGDADIEALELYTQTAGAKAVVDKQKKIKISVVTHEAVGAVRPQSAEKARDEPRQPVEGRTAA
jgi:hypothetical protein